MCVVNLTGIIELPEKKNDMHKLIYYNYFYTGVRYDHAEFEGRAKYPGYDPVDEYENEDQNGLDCNGHGTHCSSLAAGRILGVAKKATIYSVRVLGCGNSSPWSTIIDGLNYVGNRVKETGRPSVISMSLGGSYSRTVDNTLTSVINDGIPIVAAAGNERADACTRTPASNNGVITVGGSKNGGGMYYNTNGGSCVDIIAPGQFVLGAAHTCQDCTVYFTGTSMSTPLVSGAVAILLQQQSSLTPAEIKRKLTEMCCRNILDFPDLLPSLRSTTPNCLLNVNG